MSTSTTVVQDAVESLNKQNAEIAQAEAVRLINSIREKQERIVLCGERVVEFRKELDKVVKNVVDETTVYGGSLPGNANKETVAKVIEKANKDRQAVVENQANRLTASITSEQDQVAMLEKAIAELREKLGKVSVPTVTVQQITG